MPTERCTRIPYSLGYLRFPLIGVGIAIALLTLTGCSFNTLFSSSNTEQPNLLDIMPDQWIPIFSGNAWRTINIDGDLDSEFLLLYAYNTVTSESGRFINTDTVPQAAAPIGAIAIDSQTTAEYVVDYPPLATPNQGTGTYVSYRIAPSYWPSPNTAFVGRYSEENKIVISQYLTNGDGLCAATAADPDNNGESSPDNSEVSIVDTFGNTALTAVWWRGPYLGYGAAQVIGPGGLRNALVMTTAGPQDADLNNVTAPIWAVDALFPIHEPRNPQSDAVNGGFADVGRSQLCDVYRYYRGNVQTEAGSTGREDIEYADDYMGIEFCRDHVPDPFFPEAVTLKFLLEAEARDDLLFPKLEEPDREQVKREVAFMDTTEQEPGPACTEDEEEEARSNENWPVRRMYRVSDIQTRAELGYTDSYRLDRSESQTQVKHLRSFVCVEITAVDGRNDPRKKLLFFTLGHIQPYNADIDGQTVHFTDQLRVIDVADATNWGEDTCRGLIAQNDSLPNDAGEVNP